MISGTTLIFGYYSDTIAFTNSVLDDVLLNFNLAWQSEEIEVNKIVSKVTTGQQRFAMAPIEFEEVFSIGLEKHDKYYQISISNGPSLMTFHSDLKYNERIDCISFSSNIEISRFEMHSSDPNAIAYVPNKSQETLPREKATPPPTLVSCHLILYLILFDHYICILTGISSLGRLSQRPT